MKHAVLALLAACAPGRDPVARPDAASTIDGPIEVHDTLIYAHTNETLYRLDGETFAVTAIGSFDLTDRMLDIAIDRDDRMFGITATSLYTIDIATGHAALLKALPANAAGTTSLSFVPRDNAPDLLVTANDAGDVYGLDTSTGAATLLGNYGTSGGAQIRSSGDLFGVRDFGIFATVNVGNDPFAVDHLARIDPVTWHATLLPNDTGFDGVFGLAFWGGTLYGFIDRGEGVIVVLDPQTGLGSMRTTGTERWAGAGVATDAPIVLSKLP